MITQLMSWRTAGVYRGLSKADREWLKRFDRTWETKASGRIQSDLLERLTQRLDIPDLPDLAAIPHSAQEDAPTLDVRLQEVAGQIRDFTHPRPFLEGWRIYLTLLSGRRACAHFSDRTSAMQAYTSLREYFLEVLSS